MSLLFYGKGVASGILPMTRLTDRLDSWCGLPQTQHTLEGWCYRIAKGTSSAWLDSETLRGFWWNNWQYCPSLFSRWHGIAFVQLCRESNDIACQLLLICVVWGCFWLVMQHIVFGMNSCRRLWMTKFSIRLWGQRHPVHFRRGWRIWLLLPRWKCSEGWWCFCKLHHCAFWS